MLLDFIYARPMYVSESDLPYANISAVEFESGLALPILIA
jgi:hypothetical protein